MDAAWVRKTEGYVNLLYEYKYDGWKVEQFLIEAGCGEFVGHSVRRVIIISVVIVEPNSS